MTAELVLLLSLYAFLILGVFMAPGKGLFYSFQDSLPALSARIEHRVVTGQGFWYGGSKGIDWSEP